MSRSIRIETGILTVLRRSEKSHSRVYWTCECDCGNTTLVRLDSLTSGHTTSCGCREQEGKIQKMREAARFVDGTQVTKILRIMEHNASAAAEEMIGVTYDKRSGKWRASIKFQGVLHRLGSFDTPAEAAQARRDGEREWFGAYLDEPEDSGGHIAPE